MAEPYIISSYAGGKHNADLEQTISRLEKEGAYKDLSTIVIIPSLDVTVDQSNPDKPLVKGAIHPKIAMNWRSIAYPPNGKVVWLMAVGLEVGEAYSRCIESILAHPELSKYKYILTMETDNGAPPFGLIKLLSEMEAHPEYACIGGLYFTKYEGGVAQIWGDPNDHPLNFRPQKPDPNGGLVECCGTGMGFNLFRLDMFKDEKIERPWFRTACNAKEGMYTQDLLFWRNARKHGYRCAIDCSVKVSHIDLATGFEW